MAFLVEALRKLPDGKLTARRLGEYWTHDEALAAARHLIDTFLLHEFTQGAAHGINADKLIERYTLDGEQPVIMRNNDSSTNVAGFNHLAYAVERSRNICGDAKKN